MRFSRVSKNSLATSRFRPLPEPLESTSRLCIPILMVGFLHLRSLLVLLPLLVYLSIGLSVSPMIGAAARRLESMQRLPISRRKSTISKSRTLPCRKLYRLSGGVVYHVSKLVAHMPSKLREVLVMRSRFILFLLFPFHVLIRIVKNYVGDVYFLVFGLPVSLTILCIKSWPPISTHLPWYVGAAYFILAFRVLIGTVLTVIDLPGYFLAFVHLLVYGIDELDS